MVESSIRIIIFQIMLLTRITNGAMQISSPTRELRLEQFQQCPDAPNTWIVFKDIVLSQAGRNDIDITGKIILNHVVGGNPIELMIEMNRCSSKQDIGTCEYYTRVKLNNACQVGKIFGSFLKASNIPINCPIAAPAEYHLNHTRIDLSELKFLPLFDAYWKTRATLTESKKLILCVGIEYSIKQTARRVRT